MCPYALSADAGIVHCVHAGLTLSVHAQVPFDYPGKLRYYSVRSSATGQPTKSVQCNPNVKADVWYRLYYISPGGHTTPGRAWE